MTRCRAELTLTNDSGTRRFREIKTCAACGKHEAVPGRDKCRYHLYQGCSFKDGWKQENTQ
jgi:hypothetical protein